MADEEKKTVSSKGTLPSNFLGMSPMLTKAVTDYHETRTYKRNIAEQYEAEIRGTERVSGYTDIDDDETSVSRFNIKR